MRFSRRDGLMFAAGVFCGVFLKTALANNNATEKSFVDSLPSGQEIRDKIENYIQTIHNTMQNGAPAPKLPTKIEGVIVPPECFMTVPEMIRDLGFVCEEHKVVTADNYQLTVHRIPHSRNENEHTRRPVVFLQHGLLADSASWTVNGANRSLAFILADQGYDVWMGNVRGNTYSRKHVVMNPDTDAQYWKFSWQEISEHDLPAMVDHALTTSGQKQLYYVGHSQGTLIMFTRLAEDAAFNEKIKLFFALGPVYNLEHIKSPIRNLLPLHGALHFGQKILGIGELLPNLEIGKWFNTKLHSMISSSKELSYHGENIMFLLSGFRPSRYWTDRMAVFMSHTPAGTSVQNIIHFTQMIQKKSTQKFDFGTTDGNSKCYGCTEPPSYELEKITAPIALFWGSEDNLADPDDILSIIPRLKTVVRAKQLKDWDHLEYIWGKYAIENLYNDIIDMIRTSETIDSNKTEL